MKIIKRNGSEAVFDITKIIAAITKANHVVPESQRLTKEQIIEISDHVQTSCLSRGHAMKRWRRSRTWSRMRSCRPAPLRLPVNISPTAMCRA